MKDLSLLYREKKFILVYGARGSGLRKRYGHSLQTPY
jgi:hypothetical protein